MVTVLIYFALFYSSHAYVGQDYSIQKNVGKISLEQIDSVSCTDHRLRSENLLKYCCQSSRDERAAVILHVLPERERRELKMGREMKWELVHFCMSVICCCPPSAFREIVPTVHEAAAPEPEGKPPSPPRWPHAVRPLPQRHRPVFGASSAVLEVGVHKGQSGHRQGIVGNFNAMGRIFLWEIIIKTLHSVN